MKVVEAFCAPTWYKVKCIITLSPVAANASAAPKDFLRAALVATMEEVKIWTEKSVAMKNDSFVRADNDGLDYCKEDLQMGLEDLQSALAMLHDDELHAVYGEVYKFQDWLVGNLVYQTDSCFEFIQNPDLKARLQDGLRNAIQLTANSLALLTSSPASFPP
ncbi:hypothetical protein NE237_015325 [Protea cynaroides]|uniref:Pectinesterase inhibitor domain-containing protein n=1 Tax=Protea cynaroides TaxID=273540 RepID=A0A9Q0QR43_9MAGN|nr:hypothetical protein NE237_015325 [Protea cynaroides]